MRRAPSRSSDNALIATSAIPNPRPAAMPSRRPRWTGSRSIWCETTSARPSPTAIASKMISPPGEYSERAPPPPVPPVSVTRLSETATRPIPIHWRRSSANPKKRSASTARKTSPPASTAWPTESGARVSAATCSANATTATHQPIVHHLDRKRSAALRSGWRMSTSAAATAPLYFNKKARFVPSADSSEQSSPTPTTRLMPVTVKSLSEGWSSAAALRPPAACPHRHGTPSCVKGLHVPEALSPRPVGSPCSGAMNRSG